MTKGMLTRFAPTSMRHWPKWAALLVSLLFMALGSAYLPEWAREYPRAWTPDFQSVVASAMYWLVDDAAIGPVTFSDFTRGIAWLLELPMRLLEGLFATGFTSGSGTQAHQVFPPIPWFAVLGLATWLGHRVGGTRLALLHAISFSYLAVFGQWHSSMITLASIVVAVPLGIVVGTAAGIAAYRNNWTERAIVPLLDLMQTVPTFAYLVPILFLFGFGPAAAIVATVIYATPPMRPGEPP